MATKFEMTRRTAVSAVMVSALAACGRSSSGTSSKSSATGSAVASGKATGTLEMWAMGAEGESLPQLVKDFETANPGVKVNITAIPWNSAHDKFTSAITAGKTPDLAMVGSTWMGEFAGQDALDPTPSSFDKSIFFEGPQKGTEVNGTSYGVPWYVETRCLYYRTDLAQKAGITKAPETWDDLKTLAKAMKEKAGAKWGIGLQAGGQGSWQTVLPFAWTNGADITGDGGKSYNFDSAPLAEAVTYYQSFFTEGLADKAAPATPTTEPDFVSGKVPMFVSGPWEMAAVEKLGGAGFKDKYAVAQLPMKKEHGSFAGGANLAVFKGSKNRDSAWKLIEFLVDPKVQAKWYTLSTDLPSVKSAWKEGTLASDKKLSVFGTQLETAKTPPSFPTWEQAVMKFDSAIEQITKKGANVAAQLKSAQAGAAAIGTGQ